MVDKPTKFDWQIVWLILLALFVLGVMATWMAVIFTPGTSLLWD